MAPGDGFRVVLTADRTLMADYGLLFDGVLAANQTTRTPSFLVRALLLPRAKSEGVRARVAPLGLRRIEAALVAGGFGQDEVAVVEEEQLPRAVGAATRVVGISTGDPLGLGMSTTTTAAIAGGSPRTAAAFRQMMKAVHRSRLSQPRPPAVVVGGPGAWQLAAAPEPRRELGIQHVITGYAEGNAADLFRSLADGAGLPEVAAGEPVGADRIPRILGASTMGVVEIGRGCGLGCSFCTISRTPMLHVPPDTVLADAETNLRAGLRNLCVISEDVFRYGGTGLRANPAALLNLLARLRGLDGVGLIQTDHGNVMTAAQFSDEELERVRELMVGPTGQRYPWVNIGVESASGELLKANGCAAKMGDAPPSEWAAFCTAQLRRLVRAGFLPIASVVVGLPGETETDTRLTLRWVESLLAERVAIFPLLYAPIDGGPPITAGDVSPLQWRLIRTCYRSNFKWIPRMFWDSQRAAGVGLARRCVMQVLGRCQAALWKSTIAWRSRRWRGAGPG